MSRCIEQEGPFNNTAENNSHPLCLGCPDTRGYFCDAVLQRGHKRRHIVTAFLPALKYEEKLTIDNANVRTYVRYNLTNT